jgi:exosortase/archaeosortase
MSPPLVPAEAIAGTPSPRVRTAATATVKIRILLVKNFIRNYLLGLIEMNQYFKKAAVSPFANPE